jgi:methyl-accepting chemotaxis protein
VQQAVANTTQIAASVDRISRVAEQLPAQLSTERAEILKSLQAQEKELTPLVGEVRGTLAAGTQLSASLNTTVVSLDALMKRFGVGEPKPPGPPAPPGEPFRIQDYTQTAAQFEATARQLTELLQTLDTIASPENLARLTAQVGPAVQQVQAGGREVVDYAFWKALLLVAVVLVAALSYRLAVAKLLPPRKP